MSDSDIGSVYGSQSRIKRVRVRHLQEAKERGEKWPMLTAYDTVTARIFDAEGIPALLVGDSAANVVYGYESSLRVEVDELLPLVKAVVRSAQRALVVADLPFGSYEASPSQAVETASRFMKAGAQAVKLEGGRRMADTIRALTNAGIPVMAHVGFTPQAEHALGGFRVQGRDAKAAEVLADAQAVVDAGAFSVVLEMVTSSIAEEITKQIPVPTIGIGAGNSTDAQVLVWQDMAGFTDGRTPKFVKRFAELGDGLAQAARDYAAEVRSGEFPAKEHGFE
ncbi:3-methyl-2-oxobutanoate hydroxymethyltransferase [Haloglycomyces albus]|uniref:3-methyl-2-oxobutanoate hydroxymethyltransferase n=1 Tax=Haloglycomyces albus TaxID=526067 RepID=UPI00046CC040|nr:3-methyl-2-oxobutanoate hydroxymethyltransferase [Haloglycomyces albus]